MQPNQAERQLLNHCVSDQKKLRAAEDLATKSAIKSKFETFPKWTENLSQNPVNTRARLQGMVDFFKHDYMTWMNSPQCTVCDIATTGGGQRTPNEMEKIIGTVYCRTTVTS